MFPNPQSALPLPPRPSLERYRKIAKELVKACRSADERVPDESVPDRDWAEAWAEEWIDALVRLLGLEIGPNLPVRVEGWIDSVAGFARRQLLSNRRCALADAQFVIARSHGFESWPKFVRQLEALESANSAESRFEAAADAIVAGDAAGLKSLLEAEPGLIRRRSMREHGATLLHYVAANGVESYRQRTPPNIVAIAVMLLGAGAEVEATANVYGGGATALGLAATSVHPERAGVQEDLLRLLLEHGAGIGPGLVRACLSNGRGLAAEFLANQGADLDLDEAAGAGRLELVQDFFAEDGSLLRGATQEQLQEGFLDACEYGRDEVIAYLIARGADIAAMGRGGQSSMHRSVIGGHPSTVKVLLRHGARLEAKNRYGGTALEQAMWSAGHGGDAETYIDILEELVAAGARLPERHVAVNAQVDGWLEQRGSHAEPGWNWYGEMPSRKGARSLPE